MNKKNILIILGVFIIMQAGFSLGLINPGESDQSSSTMGFEKNQYDWLIDPAYFGKIEKSTIFFSLDSAAGQFGANTVGHGFRGGFAWIMNGFSPLFAVNYKTSATSSDQSSDNNQNTEYDYGSYDTATGRYATIDEIVNITTSANPYHRLMLHFGGRLNGPVSFDLQTYWFMDRENGKSSSHTDQYTNTASVSPASLNSKGDLTETVYDLIANKDNLLAVESEAGLNLGIVSSTIALGTGFYNLGSADDSYVSTVTSYSMGVSPTAMDQQVITNYTGSYYYNGSVQPCFGMNTSNPVHIQRTIINLDTDTVIPLGDTLKIESPLYFDIALSPTLTTVFNTTTIGYDDSTATPQESTRTGNITTTNLTVNYDINWGIGTSVKKTWHPTDNSALYIGGGLRFDMGMYSDTRNRTNQVHTQVDNNADGAYTTAGTDWDTTYTQSGWEIQTKEDDYTITLNLPVAVSYSPVKILTFHAGAQTSMAVTLTNSSTLETGDSNYVYETFTDNLTAANSYDQRQIDGSNNTNKPYSEFASNFNFGTNGSFGFTLAISDNFTIDAVALANMVEFDQFSLTGIYSY